MSPISWHMVTGVDRWRLHYLTLSLPVYHYNGIGDVHNVYAVVVAKGLTNISELFSNYFVISYVHNFTLMQCSSVGQSHILEVRPRGSCNVELN